MKAQHLHFSNSKQYMHTHMQEKERDGGERNTQDSSGILQYFLYLSVLYFNKWNYVPGSLNEIGLMRDKSCRQLHIIYSIAYVKKFVSVYIFVALLIIFLLSAETDFKILRTLVLSWY